MQDQDSVMVTSILVSSLLLFFIKEFSCNSPHVVAVCYCTQTIITCIYCDVVQ